MTDAAAATRPTLTAASFSIVLGLSGLGQSWRVAVKLWGANPLAGEIILAGAGLVWTSLLIGYLLHAIRQPHQVRAEFCHPVQGSAAALLGIATLLMALAILPVSRGAAIGLTAAGIGWHLLFALWHAGDAWQRGRAIDDLAPNIYLPTVAGNFVSGAALGALGRPDWGWLFLGAGFFSWLALESLVLGRFWRSELPAMQRPLVGVQFAPPAVAGMAWLLIAPRAPEPLLLMLWGYALFQLLLGLRLWRWLRAQPFTPSYWSYTFGAGSTLLVGLKLALLGLPAAGAIAPVLFGAYNLFILYLIAATLGEAVRRARHPSAESPGSTRPENPPSRAP